MILITFLVMPVFIIIGLLFYNSSASSKQLTYEAAGINNSVGSNSFEEIVSSKLDDKPLAQKKLSAYEVNCLAMKLSLTKYLQSTFDGIVDWYPVNLNGMYENKEFFIKIVYPSGIRNKVLIKKVSSYDGYQFCVIHSSDSVVPDPKPTEPDPVEHKENDWISTNLEYLIQAKKACIQKDEDSFLYDIPDDDEIKDTLELKGFFIVDSEDGYRIYF